MSVAVYPGSFDPITNGHLDIVERALKAFDRIIIAVAVNPRKDGLFTVAERVKMIGDLYADNDKVEVDTFSGLLVNYLRKRNAAAVVRGLRAVSDFEYEFQMANMNRKLYGSAETFFLMTGNDYFYVSSSLVKEVVTLGGCVTGLVPESVRKALELRVGGEKQ
jgi:pantetheine-phosphate adenylyltransferase